MSNFVAQYQQYFGTVGINTTSYASPVYVVPAGQPMVAVKAVRCVGGVATTNPPDPGFAAQVAWVPIPAGAVSAVGNDHDMIVWQPSTDTDWELGHAQIINGQWQVCWGGRMTNMSSSSGVFPFPYGIPATGLSVLAGMMRINEAQTGAINHVINVSLPVTQLGTFVAPANRNDGWSTSPMAIPEGTRFRLNPNLDIASLNLNPFAAMIAKTLQTYGMVVVDTAGAVVFTAQDPTPLIASGQPNPWPALWGGMPQWKVLQGIPWSQLQVVS